MLVRFKRNWFGPDGVRYKTRDGLHEIADGLRDQLPKDAEVVETKVKELPPKALAPQPGFGAIPDWEQKLADLGAAPTHQITAGAGENQEPSKGDALDEDGSARRASARRVEEEKKAEEARVADEKAIQDKANADKVAADRANLVTTKTVPSKKGATDL